MRGSYARRWDGVSPPPPPLAWQVQGDEALFSALCVASRLYTTALLRATIAEREAMEFGPISLQYEVMPRARAREACACRDEGHRAYAVEWLEDAPAASAAHSQGMELVHTLRVEGAEAVVLSHSALADLANALYEILEVLPAARQALAPPPLALPAPWLGDRLRSSAPARMAASLAALAAATALAVCAGGAALQLRAGLPAKAAAARAAAAAQGSTPGEGDTSGPSSPPQT